MLEASQELFSGAGSYLGRLSVMIFRPGRAGSKIAREVRERLDGRTTKRHAARFFYSTLGAILFAYLAAGLLLIWDGPEVSASQFYQASYFLAAVIACEAISLLSFCSGDDRKIHAAISIHAVSLWIILISVSVIVVGAIFYWNGILTSQPELFLGAISLIALLIGILATITFLYRATRTALGWPIWRAFLQALLSTVILLCVFGAGGFLVSILSIA